MWTATAEPVERLEPLNRAQCPSRGHQTGLTRVLPPKEVGAITVRLVVARVRAAEADEDAKRQQAD